MKERRWVVRWDGTEPSLNRSNVVLLLPAAWKCDRVAAHLESVYVALVWLEADKWAWSKYRKDLRVRACLNVEDHLISCGDNPWLEARRELIEEPYLETGYVCWEDALS